jgi:hypothetical protein
MAAANREPAQYSRKIASQPLDGALQELARQSGIQSVFFSRLTEGFQSPGLHGGRFRAVQNCSIRSAPIRQCGTAHPGVSINCCFRPGTSRSRGVDAELSGELAPGWLLGAGYTLNVNHSLLGGELSKETPRHLLKLWTSRQLPGRLQRWSVGGSVHAQSRNTRDGAYCAQSAGVAFGFCSDDELVPFQLVQLALRCGGRADRFSCQCESAGGAQCKQCALNEPVAADMSASSRDIAANDQPGSSAE